ncbi:hypothetical protein V2J09_014696 [Rumex salicifolius]
MKNRQTEIPTSSKIIFDDSEESDSSSDEEAEIERELADIPFGELQKARSDGTLSSNQKFNPEKKLARANKNRPMEISSKKPVGRFREVIQAPKKIARDPRFENLCGKLDTEGFKKRYNFLYQEHLPAEKADLLKQLKKSKDPEVTADLKSRISEIEKQLKTASTKNVEKQILTAHKKKEREAAKQGKQPFYLKKSEVRKQKLIQKYESLKDAGKLDAYIEKRRKRNASKDQRFMPYRRPVNNE